MLLRMYSAGPSGAATKSMIDEHAGEEAGIKSATLRSRAKRLWLAEDRKRRAPAGADLPLFNARRHTSFTWYGSFR